MKKGDKKIMINDSRITNEEMEKTILLLRKYQKEKITLKEYNELYTLFRKLANQLMFDDNPYERNYHFNDKKPF